MIYQNDKYPLKLRTNDNFKRVINVGYDISTFTPKFEIKTAGSPIDWSSYITKTTSTTITIEVKASIIAQVGVLFSTYDCIIDMGSGSKDVLFAGQIEIVEGIS